MTTEIVPQSTAAQPVPFDPMPYLKDLSNGRGPARLYLPAAYRIQWFRAEHPITSGWSVQTEALAFTPAYIVKATVHNPDGRAIASGHAMCTPANGKPYTDRELEKAETSAIARALSVAGYGTQFALDPDESDVEPLAEAPIQPTKPAKPAPFQTVATAPGADKLNGKNGTTATYDPAAVRWSETVAAIVDNPYYGDRKHVTATLRILVASGLLKIGAPVAEAVELLNKYSTLRTTHFDQDGAIAQLQFLARPELAANGNGKAVAS